MANKSVNESSTGLKFKRIIVCCDGTWMDSLGDKGAEPASNVTRISRLFKRTCFDDRVIQITFYQPGVGSDGSTFQRYAAGFLGTGLEAHICEAYNFICANYVDGDEIILTGFSRGAFTARSIADMIASVGLLTPEGLDNFHAIFNDYESMGDDKRNSGDFMCPDLEKYGGQTGVAKGQWEERRKDQFREWLKKDPRNYTRDTEKNGKNITIKALGVWDTVGTLGIPPAPAVGIISSKVENAFQALALDEPRAPFLPALWERTEDNSTNLKQVWFPGNHGGVGGGWYDQQISNITLAWMCDQLSSIGVEFSFDRMTATFNNGKSFSAAHPFPYVPASGFKSWFVNTQPPSWAIPAIYRNSEAKAKQDSENCSGHDNHPVDPRDSRWLNARPWGLGQTREAGSWVQSLSGQVVRKPGLSMRTDPDTNELTNEPLARTNERIHSSVRVRLACGGLSMDDKEPWKCLPLRGKDSKEGGPPLWRLEHESGIDKFEAEYLKGFKPNELSLSSKEYPESVLYKPASQDGKWRWVYNTKPSRQGVPQSQILPEEPVVGYWERYLLNLTVSGKEDVWRWANTNPPTRFMKR